MPTELLFRDDAYLKTATARVVAAHDGQIEFDRTIFYPLGGGQPGDTGFLVRENGERLAIADTRKGETRRDPSPTSSPRTAGCRKPAKTYCSNSTGRAVTPSCACTRRCT